MSLKFLSLKYCCNNEQIGPNTLSYIHLATCGIPISHHILHILVRLLIMHYKCIDALGKYLQVKVNYESKLGE